MVLLDGAVTLTQLLPVDHVVFVETLFQLCSVAQLETGAKKAASASRTAIRIRRTEKNGGVVFIGREGGVEVERGELG